MPEHQQIQQFQNLKPSSQIRTTLASHTLISNPAAIIQRARIYPKSLTSVDILQLQRTIGNRAVGRLLAGNERSSITQQAPIQRQEIPEEEELLQGKMIETVQRQEIPEEEEPLQGIFENKSEKSICTSCSTSSIQRKEENRTGLPDNLKAGVENLSGIDMSDVRVHYNSSKPAEIGALAYTQGTEIHVAPGQERHLLHEAWHVVQQAKGRVGPTMQLKEVAMNDDRGLEWEADAMGDNALQMQYLNQNPTCTVTQTASAEPPEMELKEAPKVLFLGIVTSQDKTRLNYLTTEPIAKKNSSIRVIQRLTADNQQPYHNANPIRTNVHDITETKTSMAGVESDTGNFTHANGSEYLDNHYVYYKGLYIGHITTIGADGNTIVKMHLVNSYLNPNANSWPNNWVWGSQTLNHRHNEIEELAKLEHPDKKQTNLSLNYETQADANSRPSHSMTGDDLANQIHNKVLLSFNGMKNFNIPSLVSFKSDIMINNINIDNFVQIWNNSVGNTATTQVTVRYRALTNGNWGLITTDNRTDDNGDYSIYFSGDQVFNTLSPLWIDITAGRPKRTQK